MSRPKQRRYIADPHLLDPKVAALRGFDLPSAHDAEFIRAWCRSVPDNDTPVFVLGDICKGNLESWEHALQLIVELPGEKHLIAGNHDRVHPLHPNGRRYQREAMEVFTSVSTADQVNINGRQVMLSHFPFRGEHGSEPDRHPSWRLRDRGKWLVHGHVHDEWSIRGRQINVSWERWPDKFPTDNDVARIIELTEALEHQVHEEIMDWGGGS